MVQKEVADRMQTGPVTRITVRLSLAVQYYARSVYRGKCTAELFYAETEGWFSSHSSYKTSG